MKLTSLLITATLALAPAALHAQQTTSGVTTPIAPVTTPVGTKPLTDPKDATSKSIAARKTDQQDRIANGIKDGQLTAGESSKLEGQESAINKEETAMRAQDNGKLTKSDKETLTKQQNAESRRIRRDRHNARKVK